VHPTPRTVGEGDIALYLALTGSRHVIGCAAPVAHALGYPARPLDEMLVFHLAFGKTVADISLNAVANLGYADVRFLAPVYVGDSLAAESTVIGLKENSSGDSRRGLGAFDGGEPERRGSADLDPLGDGEEAGPERAPRPRR
jgi:2-methylfumaryl-CoA hydratase